MNLFSQEDLLLVLLQQLQELKKEIVKVRMILESDIKIVNFKLSNEM